MLYIGVDLGTSAVKLLLMDEKGKIRKIVSRSYPISFPQPGRSEQNPEDWLNETMKGIEDLVDGFDRGNVAGIGVCGQMHGLVILDENDKVIRPAILWNDGRSAEETEYLNEVIGRERLSRNTANIAFAGFTAPKLLWLKKHEPDNFAKIRKIMLPKDYINYMLAGAFCTDCSDASGTLFFDVKNRCWSTDMLEICGITVQQVPRIFESFEPIGTLKSSVAETLGLPKTVRVCAGAGDNAAAAVGTGTIGNGKCNISLGTSGTVFISGKKFSADPTNALHSFAHADGNFHLMGCMLSAASCNKWWQENIIGTADLKGEESKITDDMLGRSRVFFLPYLMGERSPINDTNARGTFIGMTMDTERRDMTLAVLEGVAFGIRDSVEAARKTGVKITRSKICGGGAKSPLWKKIFANVLNMNIDIVETEEGPGYGGAILAAVACGQWKSVETAAEQLVKIVDTVSPDPEISARYEEQYAKFTQIYPAVKELFPKLNG